MFRTWRSNIVERLLFRQFDQITYNSLSTTFLAHLEVPYCTQRLLESQNKSIEVYELGGIRIKYQTLGRLV